MLNHLIYICVCFTSRTLSAYLGSRACRQHASKLCRPLYGTILVFCKYGCQNITQNILYTWGLSGADDCQTVPRTDGQDIVVGRLVFVPSCISRVRTYIPRRRKCSPRTLSQLSFTVLQHIISPLCPSLEFVRKNLLSSTLTVAL